MLNNQEIYEQSLVDHLYYSRTIRSFCISIGQSFFGNNRKYIDEAIILGTRATDIGNLAISYANGKIGKEIVQSNFYITPYTEDIEKLTEKLFGNSLSTNIINDINLLENKKEVSLTDDVIANIEILNEQGLKVANDFCEFCINIENKLKLNELFSYLYLDFFNYMYDAVNIYIQDLERIKKKQNYAPVYIQNYEYYFNETLKKTAKFLRGYLDTRHQDIFDMASYYVNAFANIAERYLKEEKTKKLSNDAETLVINYRNFLTSVIEKLLNSDVYFITPAVSIDHFLASTNVYLYIVKYLRDNPNITEFLI